MTNLSSIINTSGDWANAGAPPSIALEAPVPKPSETIGLTSTSSTTGERRPVALPARFPRNYRGCIHYTVDRIINNAAEAARARQHIGQSLYGNSLRLGSKQDLEIGECHSLRRAQIALGDQMRHTLRQYPHCSLSDRGD